MRMILLAACCAALSAQIPDVDSRNTAIPTTDTHFTARAYGSVEEWESRKDDLRRQILFAAGLLPAREKTALNARIFGRIEREGYSVEKVLLETLPGYYLGGNLYRPEGDGPFPAILKPHGHWAYGRLENQPLNSTQTLAANLARLGLVVLAYDMVGYNDTAQTPHRFTSREMQLWNFNPLGLQLWNSIRVVDFLESLPEVDRSRIGATGASGGATQVFLLTAVDERIAVSAPVNMVSAIMQGGCVCENAPGLRIGTYNVEIAGMTAPRPQLLVAATGDWTKNVPKEEFPALREFYALYGTPELVEAVQFDAPHNYHRESRTAVYRFLAKRLLGRDDAGAIEEEETPIEQPPGLLALYGSSLPENSAGFEQVFAQWKRGARRQALATRNLAELRLNLNLALKTVWPDAVTHETSGERIVLSRAGVGDRVSGLWRPGQGVPALIVHSGGASAALDTEAARERIEAGRPVLLIDAFQTGPAAAPRDRSHEHFLTFNLSDDAARVQDIITALAFLKQERRGPVELAGLEDAAVWAVFAGAVAPTAVDLDVDLTGFRGADEDFLSRFFVPGIQRAGGLEAALRLTGGRH